MTAVVAAAAVVGIGIGSGSGSGGGGVVLEGAQGHVDGVGVGVWDCDLRARLVQTAGSLLSVAALRGGCVHGAWEEFCIPRCGGGCWDEGLEAAD